MTPVGTIATADRAAAGWSHWRAELVDTLALAWPIALTQLGQIAMMTSDLALIGRLGDEAVAAAALAHVVLFTVFMLGMGLVSAVAPLAAQAYGARDPRMVRRALRVGLWASVLLGVPLTALQLAGEELLIAVGQAPATAALASEYLTGLAWSIVPAWWFIALRNFMGAVNRPEPALWITLVAIPANAAIAYALIYGAFGLPRLEMLGAGLATTLVNLGMCAACAWIVVTRHPFRKYQAFGRIWRIDWALMRKLAVIGAPISAAFLLEYGLFAAAALLMGRIGTTALAAHQIALQVAAVMFMVPFGISMAATVRVGHAVGRADPAATRRAGFTAVGLGAVFMASMTLLVVLTRDSLPLLFLGRDAAGAGETVALAAMLLALGATFFIADGVQTIAAGALRGLNDTRVPMLFAVFSFWAVGFASAYGLAFPLALGARGVWIGFTCGLAVYALLLLWRFHLLTQRRYLPALARAE
ncbi:MAG: MATE family efflux transporter [Xanthobacteraceae bacterium]|nr:MATE family efflux transporter [Xanthobacteraceae bacterium]